MNAAELRIGNWVQPDWQENSIQVNAKMIVEQFQSNLTDTCYLSPILLTDEWLEKFGFKKRGNEYILDTQHFKLFAQEDTTFNSGCFFITRKMEISPNQVDFICNCRYVHRFQNIYYALSGEELIISCLVA